MECIASEIVDLEIVKSCRFFTGVPDSLLNQFIWSLDERHDIQHVPALNEGQALAIAFGAMLAGQEACVYLQNSGLGNMINPITSLCLPAQVYPFLIIGHRHTLAQHKVMGEIDRDLMALTNYPEDRYVIVSGSNNEK
jgi:phosphonopyruvate decarboxylase